MKKIYDVPLDIIKLMLNDLSIIDKRNFIRSCRFMYQLFPLMKNFEIEFIKLLNDKKFVDYKEINFSRRELYALEYIYYDREDIPDKYLGEYNKDIFTRYPMLYFNLAIQQTNICKKIYQRYGFFIDQIMNGSIFAENSTMVKWAVENGYKWNF